MPVTDERLRHVMERDGADFEECDQAKGGADAGESKGGEAIERGRHHGGRIIIVVETLVIITAFGIPKHPAARSSGLT
jgi:hypothetical protein